MEDSDIVVWVEIVYNGEFVYDIIIIVKNIVCVVMILNKDGFIVGYEIKEFFDLKKEVEKV